MSVIVNAMQLKNGVKVDRKSRLGLVSQPMQMIPRKEKTPEWFAENADYYELLGMKQIRRNIRRFHKNSKLAAGIIDRTDYIIDPVNEASELIEHLTKEDESAMELKFFPLIPPMINLMVGEFGKRSDKIMFRAVDDLSYNEMLEAKRAMIEETLIQKADMKIRLALMKAGVDLEGEEAQQALSSERIRSLPEIEEFFKKDYRSQMEEWATHQHQVDSERFHLKEKEEQAFRDMLENDREFWHFNMLEDDYELEYWNPYFTFYLKSPEEKYISNGTMVGKIDLLTLGDVIDKYGPELTKEQIESLYNDYPMQAALYGMTDRFQNDGGFYDPTKSHKWNTEMPSLGYRQLMSVKEMGSSHTMDLIDQVLFQEGKDLFEKFELLRVTTVYWQGMRKVGYLTKIDDQGNLKTGIVDEEYKITTPGFYDTTFAKEKTADNLYYGEHIEWIWVREVYSTIKIGPNGPTQLLHQDSVGIEPVYIRCKPLKFQFKGDQSLYGTKLPVEGCVFSERNVRSTSFVDRLKSFQVGFNLVNNQVADILVDELGTVIVFDHNTLPQHSMGEDWGKNNLNQAYVAMKNFSMLPLDTTLSNTESALNFQHYQVLNMEQTNRLMSRIQLATYFKQQAYETIGITPQRMGQVSSQETATGVEQAMNASYAQTEIYFTQHAEHLMPRVHQMRTDLAQFYHSQRPSLRLQYMTSDDEKVNFEINGTDMLSRDINLFCTTKVNHRKLMQDLKQLAMSNNTAGASIYDLANVMKAESMAEINHAMKSSEMKAERQRQEEMSQQQQLMEQQQKADAEQQEKERAFEAAENERDRQRDIRVAEIRAAGMTGTQDANNNTQNDFIDSMKYLDDRNAKAEDLQFRREDSLRRQANETERNNLTRESMQSRERISKDSLRIAQVNKNQFDKKSTSKKK